MTYAIDGQCHNAETGTFGHECGKPAIWTGENREGFRSGFCSGCRRAGYEARNVVHWQPFNRTHEIALVINRLHRDERGIIDEVAMREIFNRWSVSLADRTRIWRGLTNV